MASPRATSSCPAPWSRTRAHPRRKTLSRAYYILTEVVKGYPTKGDIGRYQPGQRHQQRRLPAATGPVDREPAAAAAVRLLRGAGCIRRVRRRVRPIGGGVPDQVESGGARRCATGSAATAAPGSAAVASKDDSGNSIKIASVIGATDDATAMPATARRVRWPMAAVGAAAPNAAGAAAASIGPAPAPLLRTALGDHGGESPADPQFRRMLEGEHRGDIAVGMMFASNLFPRLRRHGPTTRVRIRLPPPCIRPAPARRRGR